MQIAFVSIQIAAIALIVAATFGPRWSALALRRGRKGPSGDLEGAPPSPAWYWCVKTEVGILGLGAAVTALSKALSAFASPKPTVSPILFWSFQIVFLLAATLAMFATLWLFRIYVRGLRVKPTEPSRLFREETFSVLSPRQSGPYAWLAWAIIMLLLGLSLLPLMMLS
jgi:hypothetical protein